jgi:hypothetical protein
VILASPGSSYRTSGAYAPLPPIHPPIPGPGFSYTSWTVLSNLLWRVPSPSKSRPLHLSLISSSSLQPHPLHILTTSTSITPGSQRTRPRHRQRSFATAQTLQVATCHYTLPTPYPNFTRRLRTSKQHTPSSLLPTRQTLETDDPALLHRRQPLNSS